MTETGSLTCYGTHYCWTYYQIDTVRYDLVTCQVRGLGMHVMVTCRCIRKAGAENSFGHVNIQNSSGFPCSLNNFAGKKQVPNKHFDRKTANPFGHKSRNQTSTCSFLPPTYFQLLSCKYVWDVPGYSYSHASKHTLTRIQSDTVCQ